MSAVKKANTICFVCGTTNHETAYCNNPECRAEIASSKTAVMNVANQIIPFILNLTPQNAAIRITQWFNQKWQGQTRLKLNDAGDPTLETVFTNLYRKLERAYVENDWVSVNAILFLFMKDNQGTPPIVSHAHPGTSFALEQLVGGASVAAIRSDRAKLTNTLTVARQQVVNLAALKKKREMEGLNP